MKPLFTLHAGEIVTGDYIERTFKHVNSWVPTKHRCRSLSHSEEPHGMLATISTIRRQTDFSRK